MDKRFDVHSLVSSATVQLSPAPFSNLSNYRPGASLIRSLLRLLHHDVLQSRPHFPRHRRSLGQCFGRSHFLEAVRERVDWGDYQSDLEGLLNL